MIPRQTAPPDETAMDPGNLVLVEEKGLLVLCRCLTRSREMIRLAACSGRVLNLAPGGIVLLGCVIGLQRKYTPR